MGRLRGMKAGNFFTCYLFIYLFILSLPAGAISWEVDLSGPPPLKTRIFKSLEQDARSTEGEEERHRAMLTLAHRYVKNHRLQEAIWILEEIEERKLAGELRKKLESHLKTAKFEFDPAGGVDREEGGRGGGAGKPRMARYQSSITGVHKAGNWEFQHHPNSRVEVLAYRVDRLLELNIVPATIARKKRGENSWVSIQYFIKGAKLTKIGPKDDGIGYQNPDLFHMWVLDYIIANIDRHQGNLVRAAGPLLIAIDHGHCRPWQNSAHPSADQIFQIAPPFGAKQMQRMIAKLQSLSEEKFRKGLEKFASEDELNNMFKRMQEVLEYLVENKSRLEVIQALVKAPEKIFEYLEERFAELDPVGEYTTYISENAKRVLQIVSGLQTDLETNLVVWPALSSLPLLLESERISRKDFRRLLARLLGKVKIDEIFLESFLELFHKSPLIQRVWHERRGVFVESNQDDAEQVRENYLIIDKKIPCESKLEAQGKN